MNRQKAHELITAYIEGWQTNDPTRVINTLAPDCVIIESHGPTYRGLETASRWIVGWMGTGHTVDRWDVTSFCFDDAERIAAFEWRFACTVDGVHYEIDGISIAEFRNNKIASLREYRMTEKPYEWQIDTRALSQERYTQYAQGYVTSRSHAKGPELARLIKIAQPQPDWVMLDVATGGGHTALAFARHVARVIATDITPKMLEKAEAYVTGQGATNVAFEPADAQDLPFKDETFDLVTCRIAPHHFPDCARFVQESARVLKSGGLLLVQDHVLPDEENAARVVDAFERLRDPSHNRAFAADEWREMCETAGLAVSHTQQIIKRHKLLDWAQRQGCTPETIEQLSTMMHQGGALVTNWMQPQNWDTPEATFVNHHIIIASRKGN
jgi:ubiquinone/menaquinone biosynthesis C-methylase UbiE